MPRYYSFVGLPLAALFFMAAADASSPDAILLRMRDAQQNVETLEARLEQVKSYPQLGIEDPVERGKFYLQKDSSVTRVRIHIEEPDVRILTVNEGGYVLYQPRIQQAVEGQLSGGGKKGMFSGILTGSDDAMEELECDYVAEGLGTTTLSERDVTHLRFTARPGAEVYCRRIELFVDTTSWLPVQQTCEEANESLITFTLHDVEVGKALEKSLFEVKLPKDVERVRG